MDQRFVSSLFPSRIFKWCCLLPLYRAQSSVQNGRHCFVFFFPGRLRPTGLPGNNGFCGQSSKCANTPKNLQKRACGTPFLNNTGSLAHSHCPTTGRARRARRSGTCGANRINRKTLFLSKNVFQLLLLVHCFLLCVLSCFFWIPPGRSRGEWSSGPGRKARWKGEQRSPCTITVNKTLFCCIGISATS